MSLPFYFLLHQALRKNGKNGEGVLQYSILYILAKKLHSTTSYELVLATRTICFHLNILRKTSSVILIECLLRLLSITQKEARCVTTILSSSLFIESYLKEDEASSCLTDFINGIPRVDENEELFRPYAQKLEKEIEVAEKKKVIFFSSTTSSQFLFIRISLLLNAFVIHVFWWEPLK